MLFTRKNPEPMVEFYKEAPNVGAPYVTSDKKKAIPFYKNDAKMSQIVEGYSEGPKNSYAKELIDKYPLSNE